MFSLLACFALGACVDPYDYSFKEQTNYLVVEGAITTDPGPHAVTLTTTRNIFNQDNAFKLRMQNADVVITTSSGRVEPLAEEDTSGIYFTSERFRGEIGEKYRLSITLEDGRRYESEEIEIQPLPAVDSVGLEYGSKQVVTEAGSSQSSTGFFVSTYLNDPEDEQNAYLANWDYTYKILTHPELATTYDANGCECWVSTPRECCAVCWVEEEAPDFAVVNDRLNNGSMQAEYDLFFLPVVGTMLYEKIYLEVTIQSLGQEAYLFWKSVYDSRYNQGGLFDPTPNTVRANVFSTENEDELVLGYFYASDVRMVTRYIFPADFPERVDSDTGYPDSCLMLPNTTAEKPDYWDE